MSKSLTKFKHKVDKKMVSEWLKDAIYKKLPLCTGQYFNYEDQANIVGATIEDLVNLMGLKIELALRSYFLSTDPALQEEDKEYALEMLEACLKIEGVQQIIIRVLFENHVNKEHENDKIIARTFVRW